MPDTDYGIMAKLDVTVGQLASEARAQREQRARAQKAAYPTLVKFRGAVTVASSGLAVVNFDNSGPDQGHLWYVRRLFVSGLTRATTAAGTADFYVTTASYSVFGSAAGIGVGEQFDWAAAIPATAFYGRGEVPLQFGEKLVGIITGGTTGQQYIVNGVAEDWQEAAIAQDYSR